MHIQNLNHPPTDVVILAGGQARRMNGINKLLQKFDDQIQLIKLHQCFKSQAKQVWINSHRDHSIYQMLEPHAKSFADDERGFWGPMMGMKSAWSHVEQDYVLFVPCDVTYIPKHVLPRLHAALARHSSAKVAYVEMNGVAIYPFCLMHRDSLSILQYHLSSAQRSLKACFQDLHAQVANFHNQSLFLHSINSLDELQQYRQLQYLPK